MPIEDHASGFVNEVAPALADVAKGVFLAVLSVFAGVILAVLAVLAVSVSIHAFTSR